MSANPLGQRLCQKCAAAAVVLEAMGGVDERIGMHVVSLCPCGPRVECVEALCGVGERVDVAAECVGDVLVVSLLALELLALGAQLVPTCEERLGAFADLGEGGLPHSRRRWWRC